MELKNTETLSIDAALMAMMIKYKANPKKGIEELDESNWISTDRKSLSETGEEGLKIYFNELERGDKIKDLPKQLKEIWPKGMHPSGSCPWTESEKLIARRLDEFRKKFDVKYTDEEILAAAKKYVSQYPDPQNSRMRVLKYFIYKNKEGEMSSDLLNLLESGEDLSQPTVTYCNSFIM